LKTTNKQFENIVWYNCSKLSETKLSGEPLVSFSSFCDPQLFLEVNALCALRVSWSNHILFLSFWARQTSVFIYQISQGMCGLIHLSIVQCIVGSRCLSKLRRASSTACPSGSTANRTSPNRRASGRAPFRQFVSRMKGIRVASYCSGGKGNKENSEVLTIMLTGEFVSSVARYGHKTTWIPACSLI